MERRRRNYIGRELLLSGVYERYLTEVFIEALKGCRSVVDIGANFGHFSLIAANLPAIEHVHAFEPHPESFADLEANRRVQNNDKLVLHNAAVGDRDTTVEFHEDARHHGNHSLARANLEVFGKTLPVTLRRLDSLVEEWAKTPPVDFLRIDAQGAERTILQGGQTTIEKNHPAILMEFWPFGLKNLGTDPDEMLQWLKMRGYRFQVIDTPSRSLIDVDADATNIAPYLNQDQSTDLLCT